jgi:hypothetical protein
MEAIIKISGEWDREDLKDILAQVSEQARTEAETRSRKVTIKQIEQMLPLKLNIYEILESLKKS